MPATVPPPAAPVDKSGERVRRMFGQIAGRYDLLNHLLSLNIDKAWRRRTVKLVPPAVGMRVLDVCTGTGDLALAYHAAGDGQVEVVGTDFCHEMLEVARQKGATGGRESIPWIEADAQHLPFDDDAFDIVTVAFGLRNVADTDAGLREMTRVCRPGGKVAVLEFTTPRKQPLKGMYGWYFRRVLPRIGQLLARNHECAYDYLPASVGQFPQYEQLAQRMQAAGLSDVVFHPFTLGVATLYVGAKPTTDC
ncbi:MAG: bifunctional demethylmenaquinone methyltransferase/2-methoxy-6-polyprenyl-1,4-benzoquinol methylase UbiE [Planctomycetaceae bacterium]|nr:bifunctional demethylmenaquinone methyltransferase/2-methoxy-6-polyprenyl-1,4-benzoquinol methylase UbiE [Planctomycetaceae bacterium]